MRVTNTQLLHFTEKEVRAPGERICPRKISALYIVILNLETPARGGMGTAFHNPSSLPTIKSKSIYQLLVSNIPKWLMFGRSLPAVLSEQTLGR